MTQNFLKIAPFQIYSSSVDTGYNAEISASFKPGIDITNMKTDRYSDLNDAPMQGVFAEKYVGGSQFRHIGLNDGNDDPNSRPELYNIVMTSSLLKVVGPDSIDVNRPRASYFRDGFSKRPVNLANIHSTGSDVGNYEHDYQILQTVSRTTNNRAFTEATGSGFAQYLTTQYVTGAKDPNRTLPNFDLNGKNEFVFVSRFNAPGGTDVSSRGVLDTYAEEYAPSNDLNTRNHTVRSQLRSDLARHTPKAGTGIPTSYHNDNRNTKYYKRWQQSPQDSIEDLVTISGPSDPKGIALDTDSKKMYWTDSSTDKIQRANFDGSDVEDLVTIVGTSTLRGIALDVSAGKMYWIDSSTQKIQRANFDGSTIEDLVVVGSFGINYIALDVSAGKMYWTDSTTDKIQRANLDGSSVEDLVTIAGSSFLQGIALDVSAGKMYWIDSRIATTDKIQRANLDGSNIEDLVEVAGSSALRDIVLDTQARKMYWTDSGNDKIQRANLDGSSIEDFVTIADGTPGASELAGIDLDTAGGKAYWVDDITDGKIQRANIPEKLVYDNGFVNHEIPQADLRYAWIAASALTTESQLPGHQQSSSVPYGPYDDIDYVLSSSEGRGDFLGISGSTLNKANISIETPLGSTNFLSKSSGVIFNVYNGPYQHSSWNQVRNSYNPVVKKLVENSILSLANRQKTITNSNGNQVNSIRSDGVTNYKEPVVSSNSRPIEHSLIVRPDLTSPQTVSSSLKYTYTNNLSTFTRVSIKEKANIKESSDPTLYGDIKEYYLDETPGGDNPVDSFVDLNYSQILYPSVVNAYINTTRYRTEYSEVAGTGSNGYDRIFGTQRTFYKDDQIRSEGAPNSQGFIASDTAVDFSSSYDFSTSIDQTFTKDASSIVRFDDTSGSNAFCFGTNAPSVEPDARFLRWNDTFQTSSVSSDISISFEITKGFYGLFDGTITLDEPIGSNNILVQYKSQATGTVWQTIQTITPAELTAGTYSPTGTSFDPGEPVNVRISQTDFSNNYFFDNYAIRNLQITASVVDINREALNFNSMATDGIRSFPESASYREYNGELMQDSDETMFTSVPAPSLSYLELYNVRVNQTSSGYVERLTEQIANNNSWYNTYEDFANDVRPHTKNKSIIPEFKISEHIPYYIIERGNDFRAPNKKMLSLDGASITSSANSEEDELFDDDFVTKYVYSSDSSKFADMTEEHEEVATVSRASFSCKGIKKLLPYNGFYPKERSVQLGNLLSQSLGGNVKGSYEGEDGENPEQGWQGILKPLMSPGILYNSIKSGLAVDYPIYTGSVPGLVVGDNTPSDFRLNVGPNYRLPFEALVDLKGNLPEGEDNPIRLVSSFVTDDNDTVTEDLFNYKSVWNGQKTDLFELGMHNFLAETVDFFLQDGGLKNFRSAPENEWNRFREGTSYYMDVVLRDTVEMNKFIEYSGSGEIVEDLKFGASDGEQPDRFGYSVDMVEGLPGEGLYALVGAYQDLGTPPGGSPSTGSAYLFQNKFDTRGWQQLQKITASDGPLPTDPEFGISVSIDSGSDGLYMVVGALKEDSAGTDVGAAYVFYSNSVGTFTETKVTPSSPTANDFFGASVSIVSGTNDVYFAVGATGDDTKASGAGAAYLFSYNGGTPTEQILTASDGAASDMLGTSVDVVSGTDGVYVLAGTTENDTIKGAAYLFHSTDSGILEQKLTASDQQFADQLGISVSLVSGTSGVYCSAGAIDQDAGATSNAGAAYIWKVVDVSTPGLTVEQKITASDATTSDQFGRSVSIDSGSDGIYFLVGAPAVSSSVAGLSVGQSYIYHSRSAGISEQIMSASDPTSEQNFGFASSLVSSSNSNYLYANMGAYRGSFAVSGSGAAYLFAGEFGFLSSSIGIQNVQQDYKQHGKLYGLALEDAYDPAYAAYTPPMFYGESIARIKFTPTVTDNYTLDEIIEQSTVEEIINLDSNRLATVNGFQKTLTTLQDQNRMPVSSSVSLFGKYFEKGAAWNAETGQATTIDGSVVKPSWVVATRFESPVLDVSSSEYNELYTAYAPDSDMETAFNFYSGALKRTNPRTMWTSYGKTPTGTKAVTLELKESFPSKVLGGRENLLTGSLIQQCGFKGTKKKIGTVRGTKEVSEAIVMIPYLDKAVGNVTTQIEGKNFIKLNKQQFNIQKTNYSKEGVAIKTATRRNNEQIESTTYTDMFEAMQKYNVPPNFDFMKYDDIAPFAMYFFEFNHVLDQDDLSDVWQGVMPKGALKAEKDEVSIDHIIDPYEFFGNIQDQTLVGQMKFFVFKVKQKAKQNYYEITKDSTDDSRFRFTFSNDPQATAVPPEGSYNWPYDYFSLVEGIDIEAKFTLKNKDEG